MKRMRRCLSLMLAVLITVTTIASDCMLVSAAEEITAPQTASEETVSESVAGDVTDEVKEETADTQEETEQSAEETEESTEVSEEAEQSDDAQSDSEEADDASQDSSDVTEEDASDSEQTDKEGSEAAEGAEASEETEVTAESVTYPSIDFGTKNVSGLTVSIYAPEGAFPEGTEVYVSAVSASSAKEMVADVVEEDEEVVSAKAVDITFRDKEGNEIQPLTAINLSISNANLSGEEFAVYHAGDDGDVEKVSDCGSDGAAVEVSQFSIYIVVGTETPERITYNFYNDDNTLLDSQIVKNGDNLYEPEVPVSTVDAENEFLGWFEGDSRFSAFGAAQVDSTKTTNLYAKYGKSYNVYFMNQYGNIQETKTAADKETVDTSDVVINVGATEAHVGWTLESGSETTVSSVTINGADVTLYPVIKNAYWVSFVSNGGSYVEPVYVFSGNTVAKPADPTRYGYQFAGWYSDETLTKEYSFDSKVNADATLYAKWEAQQVDYKIITWYENANDDGYSYGDCVIKKADAGTVTNVQANDYAKAGFTVQTIEQQTVAGDGSTVVNVYLKRNVYKIYFYQKKETRYSISWEVIDKLTIEAKYEANIAEQWPSRRYEGEYSAIWKVGKNEDTYQAGISTMPLNGDKFYIYSGGNTKYTLRYELESLEQSGTYVLDHEDVFTASSGLRTTEEDHYDIAGFTYTGNVSDGTKINGTITFRYDRNDYTIAFHNEEEVTPVSKAYQEDISNVSFTPERPATIPAEYVFKGWYDNRYGEGEPYDFTGKTMPANNLVFYAKWEAPTVTATFDVNGGNETIEAQTIVYNGTVERPDDPTRDGYNFAGWTVDGKPFNFQTKLSKNVTLVANWIYCSSLQVAYDAGEGTNAPTDTKNYVEKSYAKVLSAATAPADKVFLGWKLADAVYYPGDTFMISADDASDGVITLVALYGEKPSATEITYYANNGTEVSETFSDIKNNSDITVKSVEDLGFKYANKRFVAWNTKADGSGTSYQPGTTVAIDVIGTNQLYAQWEDDDAAYTVSWYDAETNEKLAASVTRKDLVNASVSVTEDDKKEFKNYVLLQETPSVFNGVVVSDGSLELKLYYVPVKTITVKANSDNVTYNGQEQSVTGFINETDKGVEVIINDTTYYVTGLAAEAKGTDAGEYVAEVTGIAVVKDATGKDVTDRFVVKTENGKLVINKKTVTMVSADDEKTYDGTALTNDNVTATGFVAGEGATYDVTGTQSDAGSSENTFTYTLKEGTKADNYNITTKNGNLTVNPVTEAVVVTITGNKDSKVYNGSTQSVSGYEVKTSNPAYTEKDFEFSGNATVAQTAVGEYQMGLTKDQFTNKNNKNFTNVDFVVIDGGLTITPVKVTVTITGNKASKVYNGEQQSVSGYEVKISKSTPAYTEADFSFEGTDSASGTAVGKYKMGLNADQFTNKNDNFEVTFEVTDGELEITKKTVIMTSASASKVYDGSVLTATDVTIIGFVAGEGVTYEVTGSQTEVGSSKNTFTYTMNEGTDASNYDIKKEEGTLTVTSCDEEIIVTITGHSDEYTYDGTEKVVTGYDVEISDERYTKDDFEFSGEAVAVGTNVGSYTMGLTKDQFTNKNNKNFTNVKFVVTDGNLTITPAKVTVTITGNKDSKVYNGNAQQVEGYNVSISDERYKETDFSFNGTKVAKGTTAGTYPMGLAKEQFTNGNDNFDVTFNVIDGELEITKAPVTVIITGNKESKVYNGKEQKAEDYEVSISNSLYKEADFTFSGEAVAKGTDVDTYAMNLTEEQFKNKNDNFNVSFVVTDGSLTITPLAVTVKITGKIENRTYNGSEQSVEGYDVEISDKLYTEDDFEFSGKAVAVGTNVGSYPMGLADGQFANSNDNFNVSFVVTDGKLEITKTTVVVTITGNKDSKVYNGNVQQVEGYNVSISDKRYKETDFSFSGTKVAEGTAAGTYPMGLADGQFTNDNDNFDVTFNVTDGELEITKAAVTVTITGKKDSKVYNGAEQKAEDYEVSISNSLYTEADFTFSGEAVAKGTDVSTYVMNLTEEQFANTNDNFTVTFDVTDGELKINKKAVTMTSATASKVYDGSALTDANVTATGFVAGEGAVYNVTGSQTEVGSSDNDFTYTLKEGTKAGNYDITTEAGTLTVTPLDAVVVTIVGNKVENDYTGSEQKAEGYTVTASSDLYNETDIAFSGSDVATGTDVGTYAMGLLQSQFENTNPNFTNVIFNVTDGELKINKKAVTMTSATASKAYDGSALTDTNVTATGFVAGEGAVYDVTGSQTEVGSSKNTFTYTLNEGTKAENYDINIVEGDLTVTPMEKEVVVTIKENGDRYTYDGTEKTVEGYTVESITIDGISTELYTEADFSFNGEAVARGTDAGSYDMDVKATDFVNNNTNFMQVTFVIVDNQLIIDPVSDEVKVIITGKFDTALYDGQAHSIKGYDITINQASADVQAAGVALVAAGNGQLTEEDVQFVGNDEVVQTNAGTYPQGLDESDFVITSKNFSNVVIEVTDGELEIQKRKVVLTSDNASKVYDGSALTKKKVVVTGDGFADNEGATYEVTGKQTEVGSSKNKFSYTLNENTLADNYEITVVFGKLTVTPAPATDDPSGDDPVTDDPTPDTPDTVIIDDEPVAMADVPDDGADQAVLGARRTRDTDAAVLGARRGTDYAVLGKRRRPDTGDSVELLAWYLALGMSALTAMAAIFQMSKNKKKVRR